MSKANWADEDESDEDISPEQALQDKLLNQVEKSRGAAPRKENRDRSGSNVSSGSQGDRTRRRGHHDQPGGGGASLAAAVGANCVAPYLPSPSNLPSTCAQSFVRAASY